MTKHYDAARGQRLPEHALDALFELVGTYVSPNFAVSIFNATTIQIVAGTVNDQVALAIMGRIRFRTTTVQAAMPGSPGAGSYDVYVTGSDNSYAQTPQPDTDNTVYDFGLEIRTSGTPATAIYRKVAQVVWSGSAITAVNMLVGSSGALSANSVGTVQLQDLSVSTAKLGNLAVTAAKIANDTITATQIAADAIGSSELAPNAVTTTELLDDAVTAAKIATDAVGSLEIAALAVGTAELAAGAVDSTKLAGGAVIAGKIAPAAIVGADVSSSIALAGSPTAVSDFVARTGVAGQTRIGAAGPASEAGVKMGSTGDVNLYRSAADELRSDDNLSLRADTAPANNAGSNSRSLRLIARYDSDATAAVVDTDYVVSANLTMQAVGATPKGTWRLQDNASATFFQVDSDGVVWIGAAGARDTRFYRGSAGLLVVESSLRVYNSDLQLQRASATDLALQAYVTGDANPRFHLRNDGRISWSDGTGGVDTNLYRSGANVLRTDDDFAVGATSGTAGGTPAGAYLAAAGLLALSRAAGQSVLTATIPGDTNVGRFTLLSDGSMVWASGSAPGDVTLARVAVGGNAALTGTWKGGMNGVVVLGKPGELHLLERLAVTWNPPAHNAHVGGTWTVSVPGINVGDEIIRMSQPENNARYLVSPEAICTIAGQVQVDVFNTDTTLVDPGSQTFSFWIMRKSAA